MREEYNFQDAKKNLYIKSEAKKFLACRLQCIYRGIYGVKKEQED